MWGVYLVSESELISLSIQFLKFIVSLYESHNLDYELFYEYCRVKLIFLEYIMSKGEVFFSPCSQKYDEIRKIIGKCNTIIDSQVLI